MFTTDYVSVKNGRLITERARLPAVGETHPPSSAAGSTLNRRGLERCPLIFGQNPSAVHTTYQKKDTGHALPLVRSKITGLPWTGTTCNGL